MSFSIPSLSGSRKALFFLALAALLAGPGQAQPKVPPGIAWQPSAASALLDIALEVTAREHERNSPRPTIGSRMLAIVVSAMHDAWAPYDASAVSTRPGGAPRRPEAERTEANKRIAIAHACKGALLFLFHEDRAYIAQRLQVFGIDPTDMGTDPATPAGVGNLAAQAVIAHRRQDGSNQLGDEAGSTGQAYADWTFYEPVNPPDRIINPDRWQPIPFDDGKGGKVTPGFLTPHWYRVKPFGLTRADQFRPGPPPKVGSEQLRREVEEVIALNANLSPGQKAIVEFMRDGPRSTGQSGHWLRFAQVISRRDKYTLDRDIQIFFAVANTAFDAFIAAWDAKRVYDSSRPWTLIRHYKKGQQIASWAGPGKGVTKRPGDDWLPYSPATFITPPFPGYVSGHSCVSGACARMLTLFTGSDTCGAVEQRHAGELTEPGYSCELMQMRDGRKTPQGDLTCDVALQLPTFTATAEMAGFSRVLGGYHIQADNLAGLELGRKVADHLWPVLQAHRGGKVPAPR